MIHGIIFDLGWTLMFYDGDWKEVNPRAAKTMAAFLNARGIAVGDNFPAVFQTARDARWKRADETGVEQTVEDALRDTLAQFGHTASPNGLLPRAVRVFFEEHLTRWHAYDDALATLQKLTRRGLRVGLFSNADDDGLVQNCVARLGFAPYLNPALSSAMPHRIRKPDPRALRLVADAWQIAPSEIVMVGDSPQYDILGAHRAGMRAILIDHGENFWWQKIPDDRANDPALRADATVKTLAEIPDVLDSWLV
jgi:HAD superfamily hydrolase (TIGR01662 family)